MTGNWKNRLTTLVRRARSTWWREGFWFLCCKLMHKCCRALGPTMEWYWRRHQARALPYRPLFSILTPIFQIPLDVLRQTIDSVVAQTYDHWELCLVVSAAENPVTLQTLHSRAENDPRIRVKVLARNLGIANNSNEALRMAKGDFIALLDHDDLLDHSALFEVARLLNGDRGLDLIYSDEDKVDMDNRTFDPFFKPDWSPDFLYACMYTGHLSVYRKTLVESLGGFSADHEYSQDYDLALKVVEQTDRIAHIPRVLYHWRTLPGSAAAGGKPYARQSNLRALADAMARRHCTADVIEDPATNLLRYHLPTRPTVSIIVPTGSGPNLKTWMHELLEKTNYPHLEILVVSGSALAGQVQDCLDFPPRVRSLSCDRPGNLSAKCNVGARQAVGEYLLFLNDDVIPLEGDWLLNMLGICQRPEVGAVSPRLVDPDQTVRCAGLITGVRGLVGMALHKLPAEVGTYYAMGHCNRNVSALSGACLLVPAKVFREVHGFDEVNTPATHADVALSFKIRAQGYLLVYTGSVTLQHQRAARRRQPWTQPRDGAELFLLKKWGGYVSQDPYCPAHLRDVFESCAGRSPVPYAMVAANDCGSSKDRGNLLLIGPDLEGLAKATRVLWTLAKHLSQAGFFVTVMSPQSGPLLEHYQALNIPVMVDPLVLSRPGALGAFMANFDGLLVDPELADPVIRAANLRNRPGFAFIHDTRFGVRLAMRDLHLQQAFFGTLGQTRRAA